MPTAAMLAAMALISAFVCGTFRTFELRIYPPGQYRPTYAAFDLEVCSHAGPVYMDIGPIQAGVGTRF